MHVSVERFARKITAGKGVLQAFGNQIRFQLSRFRQRIAASALSLRIPFLILSSALFCGLCGCLANTLLLHPNTSMILGDAQTRSMDGPEGSVLEFSVLSTVDTPRLQPGLVSVLHFHGNASRAEVEAPFIAALWQELPAEIWALNLPGYGRSTGPASLTAALAAAEHAARELRRIAPGCPLIASGISIGSTFAMALAGSGLVDGLYVQNIPPLRQLILRHGWWNLWMLAGPIALDVPAELSSLDNAKKAKVPGVFSQAGRDDVVPFELQVQIANAYAGPKRVSVRPEAKHNSGFSRKSEDRVAADLTWLHAQVTRR